MAGKIPDLADMLQEEGLEEQFWLPQFEKLKVESVEELGLLEGNMDALSTLQECIRYPWEKKALQKLLKTYEIIADKQETESQEAIKQHEKEILEMEIEKGREDAEKKISEVKQLVHELVEARSDRKDRLDKHIQELEKRACEQLRVTPLSSDKPLEKFISILEEMLEKDSAALQTKKELDNAALLQKVSGGRALQGVLLTRTIEDQQKKRECLLKVPEGVSIAATYRLKEDITSFSSKHQEDSYRATGDILGHSVAVSARAPVYGNIAIGAEMSESNRNEGESTTKEYSSTIKYCSIHVASYTISNSCLKLSDDAKDNLKRIITASESDVQEKCKTFFRTYGSHVNQGPLQFGGSFWWTCSSHGVDTEEMEMVKRLQSEAVTASASILFTGFDISSGVSFDSIKSEYAGKCSESTLASTQLVLDVNGGPTNVSDLSVWKAGLVANNSTWILTDRGSKLVAVWDVIGMNHQNELGEVREVLRKAWEEMTGLQSEPDFMPNLKYDPEEVLREVSKWNGKELTSRELEDNLRYLLDVKEDLSREMAQPQYWVDQYLSHKVLQEFLSLVVNFEDSFSTGDITILMQKIAEEEELEKLAFPDMKYIYEWLYKKSDQPSSLEIDCKDFESLLSYFKKTIDEIKRGTLVESNVSHRDIVVTNVSQAIHSLRSNYQRTYDDILIKILAFPFLNDDIITLNPLSFQDLKSMVEKFVKERKIYDAKIIEASTLQKQSLLFLLAVSNYDTVREGLFKLHLKKVGQMMEDLEPPLETVLSNELRSYLRGSYQVEQFKENLNSLVDGPIPNSGRNKSPPEKGISLQTLLSTVVAEQSTSKQEPMIPSSESNPEAHTLFSKLGLKEHYYKKLELQDALCIRSESLKMSLKKSKPTEPKQLPFLALQKLMSFDIHCRSDLMKDGRPKGKSDNSTKIHPADILLGLIICSDHFLRQDLFARLAKCQYAVPFILPDPFTKELLLPLWAMRSITKEWKCVLTVQGEDKVVERTFSVVKYPMQIISFLRLGKCQKKGASKSRILNGVISESEQHFFHRDLPGGSFKQVLGDGLVNMSWYLPAGKRDDVFPDAITFLNLHGDARDHPLQSRFLSQISSMCFVLLTEEGLDFNEHTLETLELFSSSAGGITLLNDVEEAHEAFTTLSATSIELEDLNEAEITDEIREQICDRLFAEKQLKMNLTIEDCCMALEKGIHIDEDTEFFKKGREQAREVASLVEDDGYIAKEEMLPLQGKNLWRAWGWWNKECHRLEQKGKKSANQYALEIEEKKASIRKDQHSHVETLTPLMERFIKLLLKLEVKKTERIFFLQHLILHLNGLSHERVSGLLAQYQDTKEDISKLQSTTGDAESKAKARKENASMLEAYRGKLGLLESEIARSSFGLHYLFRELGQIYEAACETSSNYGDQLSRLPKAAAELLFDGYPLELMDGDASHVPVKWVQAVINELNKKLDDPSKPLIFVLSVLGLQGTGKSTMLNTVFGLTFSTSAGRCTRGAFMQLLPVDKSIPDYSYVLVIDTEGLRTPELRTPELRTPELHTPELRTRELDLVIDTEELRTPELDSSLTRKHDNELSTFIIGLANVTFINISGEVTGDLDDILQTTVHAFIRMSKVEGDPSCQFIHQNSGASAKSLIGQESFAMQLDKWTLAAAREESCDGRYEKFSDVIQFDDQEDVHHFPGLWKGDPPMAPVNQGYSHAAQIMKFNLLEELLGETKSTNLSSFEIKINDLWEALLNENFVFSFRNTEEISSYNLLGAKFNKWERVIQAAVLDWEKKAANEINTEKKIEDIVDRKQNEINRVVQDIYKLQKEEMQMFFADKKLKHTLIQWKGKFEIKLKNVKKEWVAHANKRCVQLGKKRDAIRKFDRDQALYVGELQGKVQKIIADLKTDQDELDKSLEKRELDEAQLKKLMERKHKLFTPEKLSEFGIVFTQQQCVDLTEEDVKQILVNALTPEQAKKFLKQGRLNETELKAEFDKTWEDLVEGLNLPPVYNERMNVETQVESRLIGFAEKFEDSVNNGLKKKKLREWGDKTFKVKKKHYTVTKSSSGTGTDLIPLEAQKITNKVFEEARQHLESMMKESDTYFNDALTLELLQKVDEAIEDKSSEHFTFTREYRIKVYLTVCGNAVVQFKEMVKAFREQNDPSKYLEKYYREPLFTKFKNQYYQTAYKKALADNICAALYTPIVGQIEGSLGAKIVDRMNYEAYLHDKRALKTKILIDLGTEGNSQKFMTYLTDTKQSLKYWIEHYTIEFCNWKESSDGTHLQVLAKQEASRMISLFTHKVNEIEDEDASEWLSTFSEDVEVRRELGKQLDTRHLLPEEKLTLDLSSFKKKLKDELGNLEKRLHSYFGEIICNEKEMKKWQEKPYILLKSVYGCTEQCPFCGEQCDLEEHSGTTMKHSVAQHRPQCTNGYLTTNTKVLSLDICPADIVENGTFRSKETGLKDHPFAKYREIYPDWHIPPDPTARDSLYWKWFVGKHIDLLVSYYKAAKPKVPAKWTNLKWDKVKAKLEASYN